MEAVAAQRASARATRRAARRWPPPAGASAWNAVSKQATAGTSGSARRDGVERRERLAAGAAARAPVSVAQLRRHRVVDQRPASREAVAAVDDAVADGVDAGRSCLEQPRRARRRGVRRGEVAGAERARRRARAAASLRLLEPALTTRTRTLSSGHVQSRTSADVLAVLARVRRGGAMRASTICWRSVRGALAQPGHAVDHVHHEVEAVDVVEHRPCRTAWWSCPPPCSRARGGCRGWCAGRSGGGSATGSRGRRR